MYVGVVNNLSNQVGLQVLVYTISSVGLVFTIIITSLITVIVFLVRARSKVQMELKQLQMKTNVLYDEIPGMSPSFMDSTRNVAYDCVTKKS